MTEDNTMNYDLEKNFLNVKRSDACDDKHLKVPPDAIQALRFRLGLDISIDLEGAGEAFDTILRSLFHHEWIVRVKAIRAIELLGNQVPVEPLIVLLQDKNVVVRESVVKVLGTLGEKIPVEALISCLNDEAWSVRALVVQSLGKLEERMPVEALMGMLKDEDPTVRSTTVWTLGEHIPVKVLMNILEDEDPSVRLAVIRILERLGEHAPVEALITGLKDEDSSVREAAAKIFDKLGEFVPMEALVRALEDENEFVNQSAMEVREKLGNQELVKLFLTSLKSHMNDVRGIVHHKEVLALSEQTSKEECLMSCNYSRQENLTLLLQQTLRCLNGSQATIEPLTAALKDIDKPIREVAQQALERLHKRHEVESLIVALDFLVTEDHFAVKAEKFSTILFVLDCCLSGTNDKSRFIYQTLDACLGNGKASLLDHIFQKEDFDQGHEQILTGFKLWYGSQLDTIHFSSTTPTPQIGQQHPRLVSDNGKKLYEGLSYLEKMILSYKEGVMQRLKSWFIGIPQALHLCKRQPLDNVKRQLETHNPSLQDLSQRKKEHVDITLTCRECRQDFVFSTGEQEFYASRGLLNKPSRCFECRTRWRTSVSNGKRFYIQEHIEPNDHSNNYIECTPRKDR